MSQDPNISILSELLKYSIGFVSGLITPFVKRFFHKSESFKCAFKHPKIFEELQYREVKFYKRFGKTYKSDCPWFSLNKIKGFENFDHPYCPFGQDIQQINNTKLGKCPFSNMKIIQNKI